MTTTDAVTTAPGAATPPRPRPGDRPGARPRGGIRLASLYTLAIAVAGWALGTGTLADNSFFWHLRTGRLILDRGVPHSDPYSYTAPGIHWVAQSWLAELVYGVLDRLTGPASIRLFHGAIGAMVAALVFQLALRLTGSRPRALALSALALSSVFVLWSPRPLVIAVLLFLVLVWLVELPDGWLGRHELVVVPALMWLWANVHGTFELGFAYLALHLAGRWLDGHHPGEGRERRLLIGAGIGFLACFVNPYGAGLVLFPVQLLSRGAVLSHVIEWRSPDFHSLQGEILAAWLVVVVCAVARGRHRVSRRDLVVGIPFVLLAFWAQRNIVLVALATLPLVARAIAPDPAEERVDEEAKVSTGRLFVAAIAAIALVSAVQILGEPAFGFSGNPVTAMKVVQRDGLLGSRLVEPDGWGGYVILKYWPRQHVFVDDRFDMYPTPWMQQYFTTSDVKPGWQTLLRRENVEAIVWPTKQPLTEALAESPDWVRVHRDHTATLFVRRDVAARRGLRELG